MTDNGLSVLERLTEFASQAERKPRTALFILKTAAEDLIDNSRLRACYRHRVPNKQTVDLMYKPIEARAYYSGLMKCGQAWICPICARKMAEVRRDQLATAIENARDKFIPLLVTYTVRHWKGQPLIDLLQNMNDAYRTMKSGRAWQELKTEFRVRGEIRAIEVTYGDHGFHPHYHVIMWLDIETLQDYRIAADKIYISELREYLETRVCDLWLAALAKHGLKSSKEHGLDVKAGWTELDDYITKQGTVLPSSEDKWALPEELTYSSRKKTRDEGLNVWDLLARYAVLADPVYGELWREYVDATKGKSGLQWTRGLKSLLGVDTDEDAEVIADETEDEDILLAAIDLATWRKVLDTHAIGALWDAASTGDPAKVRRVLAKVEKRLQGALSD